MKNQIIWVLTRPAYDYDDNVYYVTDSGSELIKAFKTKKEAQNKLPEYKVRHFMENLYLFEENISNYLDPEDKHKNLINKINSLKIPLIFSPNISEPEIILAESAYKKWKPVDKELAIVEKLMEELEVYNPLSIQELEIENK